MKLIFSYWTYFNTSNSFSFVSARSNVSTLYFNIRLTLCCTKFCNRFNRSTIIDERVKNRTKLKAFYHYFFSFFFFFANGSFSNVQSRMLKQTSFTLHCLHTMFWCNSYKLFTWTQQRAFDGHSDNICAYQSEMHLLLTSFNSA